MPEFTVLKLLPSNRALLFEKPETLLLTHHPSRVPNLLRELDQYRARGYHCAGFMAYEALDFAHGLSSEEDPHSSPLLAFGIYRDYTLLQGHQIAARLDKLIALADKADFSLRRITDQNLDLFAMPDRTEAALRRFRHLKHRKAEFNKSFAEIQSELRAGNCYQINYTQREEFSFQGNPAALFRFLLAQQPVDHGALVLAPQYAILSLSPESFIEITTKNTTAHSSNDELYLIRSKPMKGTQARGASPEQDQALHESLASDPKIQAENLMILDLMRNDLGMHARSGSVRARQMFQIEAHPTVYQMTSLVEADIDGQIYSQLFSKFLYDLYPGASITGAPRRSARKIIQKLEQQKRGAYTGTIGFALALSNSKAKPLSEAGRQNNKANLDLTLVPLVAFNVAIRSLELDLVKKRAQYGSGGGIVIDSRAEAEWHELQLKQNFLIPALQDFHLIETMRMQDARIPLLPWHLKRLQAGIDHFQLRLYQSERNQNAQSMEAQIQRELTQIYREHPTGEQLIRLLVSRNDLCLSCLPLKRKPTTSKGYRLLLADTRLPAGSSQQNFKSSERTIYDAGFHRAQSLGFDDILFLNEHDELVESAIANLLYYLPTQGWMTPATGTGRLKGVYLSHLKDRYPKIKEHRCHLNELSEIKRLYTCNAVRGLQRVTEICTEARHRIYPAPHLEGRPNLSGSPK